MMTTTYITVLCFKEKFFYAGAKIHTVVNDLHERR